MSNMSYCRFQNTANDLADCESALQDLINGEEEALGEDELSAAQRIVGLCQNILGLLAAHADYAVDDWDTEKLPDVLLAINNDAERNDADQ